MRRQAFITRVSESFSERRRTHIERNEQRLHKRLVAMCAFSFIAYFLCGLVFFKLISKNEMSIFSILYLTIITLTTVGYGDVHIVNDAAKLFLCIYIFLGLLLVLSLLRWIFELLSEHKAKIEKKMTLNPTGSTGSKSDRSSYYGSDKSGLSLLQLPPQNAFSMRVLIDRIPLFDTLPEYAVMIVEDLCWGLSIIFATVFVGTVFYTVVVDNHSVVDAIYLSCATITTIGYGDVLPTSQTSRAFTIFYSVVGTILTGQALNKFNGALYRYHQSKKKEEELTRSMEVDKLFDMDANGDQMVSREEYILYKLIRLGLVDQEDVVILEEQFKLLDVGNDGCIAVTGVHDTAIDTTRQSRSSTSRSSGGILSNKPLKDYSVVETKPSDSTIPSIKQAQVHPYQATEVSPEVTGPDEV